LRPVAWLIVGLAATAVVGFAIGSNALSIPAIVLLVLVLMGAFAISRNVHDLNVPPGMTNLPGDVTKHERERRD
jgi:hypothetical protein